MCKVISTLGRLLGALLSIAPLLSPCMASAEIPVPLLKARVTDLTATLSSNEQTQLESRLRDFEQRKGSQIAVLIVPTTKPETIEQYSIRVVEEWRLGRKKVDDGVLVLIALRDRRLRIEVGRGLEGAIPDAVAKRIADESMVPYLLKGDAVRAIESGIARIAELVEKEPLPRPKPPPTIAASAPVGSASSGGLSGTVVTVVFVGVMVTMALLLVYRFAGMPGYVRKKMLLQDLLAGAIAGLVIGAIAFSVEFNWIPSFFMALGVAVALFTILLIMQILFDTHPRRRGSWADWSFGDGSSGSSGADHGELGQIFGGGGGEFAGGGASASWGNSGGDGGGDGGGGD